MILAAGKKNWIKAREDSVVAKGKGSLSTFWLRVGTTSEDSYSDAGASNASQSASVDEAMPTSEAALSDERMRRLVSWNTDALKRLLKDIIARRRAMGLPESNRNVPEKTFHVAGKTVIDEVCEVIQLPHFDSNAIATTESADTIELSPQVESQLENYVGAISAMYINNPFREYTGSRRDCPNRIVYRLLMSSICFLFR